MQAETGKDINKAVALLQQGHIVAIPTETVYGLAANALSDTAVVQIFEAKNRPFFDPLIVHLGINANPANYAAYIPELALKLMEKFWPGPLTIVLPKKEIVPDLTTAGQPTVGLRMPAHPLLQQLLAILPFPLAAPSANPFGYISPTTAKHVADQLGDKIPYILDGGACTVGLESTIIGFEGDEPVLYRLGGTPVEEIEQVTGPLRQTINLSSNPTAPGQLKSHYAPQRPVYLGDIGTLIEHYSGKSLAVISFEKSWHSPQILQNSVLSPKADLHEAAANLFKALREADASGADIIIAELLPETGLGMAINDRLRRAASKD